MAKKYKCKVCGYVHEGKSAPENCPLCKAPQSEFTLVEEKKGINTSSNSYTMIYAAVMVVLVAALLAFTASSLKNKQMKNIEIDKKVQILSSMHVLATAANAEELYEKYVQEAIIVNAAGEKQAGNGFDIETATEFKKAEDVRRLPVYLCKMDDGSEKIVLPTYGAGLWGPIWGYVCLNADRNTIFGTYFSHKGETPGLGAEIDKPFFQKQFEGKVLIKEGEFKSVTVEKKGQMALHGEDQVDAISGGTITSKGVQAMLLSSLKPYEAYLKQGTAPATVSDSTQVAADSVVVNETTPVVTSK